MLPLHKPSGAPGLTGYDRSRWGGRCLRDEGALAARELVTSFGHGKHACPAKPFSLAAMSRTVARLFERFEMTPMFDAIEPLPGQIGGVARAAAPCVVRYLPIS